MGSIVNAVDQKEMTPLHYAGLNGKSSACQLLVQMGAAIYQRDRHGCTALHGAAYKGHRETCTILANMRGHHLEHYVDATNGLATEEEIHLCRAFYHIS